MKAIVALALCMFLLLSSRLHAQKDRAIISLHAVTFADSLLKAFRFNQWNQYIDLSYPGVIKYYGGRQGFESYAQRARKMIKTTEEQEDKIELVQLVNEQTEWQCVIRKSSETIIDNKRALMLTYLVGQSKDEGATWRYFDVAFNSVENVIYIMPDIFDNITIPQREVIFQKNDVAIFSFNQ